MKVAIIGYSGAGKSTLARKLGALYDIPVLHLDTVNFLPHWVERDRETKASMIEAFLDSHTSWVIDGNYSKYSFERRLEEADLIVMLLFNRVSCFLRAYHRYRTYRYTTRPDMAEGCREKFDREFALWILKGGRSKKARERYRSIRRTYPRKTVVIKSQRQINRFEAFLTKQKINGPTL